MIFLHSTPHQATFVRTNNDLKVLKFNSRYIDLLILLFQISHIFNTSILHCYKSEPILQCPEPLSFSFSLVLTKLVIEIKLRTCMLPFYSSKELNRLATKLKLSGILHYNSPCYKSEPEFRKVFFTCCIL